MSAAAVADKRLSCCESTTQTVITAQNQERVSVIKFEVMFSQNLCKKLLHNVDIDSCLNQFIPGLEQLMYKKSTIHDT